MRNDSGHTDSPLGLLLRPPQASGLGDGHFRLLLTNAGRADLAVQLESLDPEYGLEVTFEPPLLVVPAGQERYVPLRVHPCRPLPGEEPRVYPFTITARPTEFPAWAVQVHGEWKHLAPTYELSLQPARARGVVEGIFVLQATNHSMEALTLELHAADAAAACTFAFQPAEVVVPAGQSAPAQLRVRARAPLSAAQPLGHPFTVTARPQEAAQVLRQAQGEWEQSLPALELSLEPLQPRGATEGIFQLEVRNADSVELTVGFEAVDSEGAGLFTLTPPLVVVPAGQRRPVQVRVQPRAALRTAEAQPRPFTITARPAEVPAWTCTAHAEWVQRPAPRPAIRTWGPLVLLLLGWMVAWGGGFVLISSSAALSTWPRFFTRPGYDPAMVQHLTKVLSPLLLGAVAGLVGGLVTALAISWAEPSLRRRHALAVWAGWTLSLFLGTAVLVGILALWRSSPSPLLLAPAYGGAVGLAGGTATGIVLRRAVRRVRPWAVALGWTLVWALSLGLVNLLADTLLASLGFLFVGWLDSSYGAQFVAFAILGGAIGLGGGAVTLGEIARARRRERIGSG